MKRFRVKLFSGEKVIEADTWEMMHGGTLAFRNEEGYVFLAYNHRVWSEVETLSNDKENQM